MKAWACSTATPSFPRSGRTARRSTTSSRRRETDGRCPSPAPRERVASGSEPGEGLSADGCCGPARPSPSQPFGVGPSLSRGAGEGKDARMLPYALKRLAVSVAIVAVAIGLIFCMIYVIPGDPVKVALGPRATPDMVAHFRQKMGLDLPLYVQLLNYFGQVLRGDLGSDVLSGRSVALSILDALPFALALIAGSMSWSILIGVPLGCYAAVRRGSTIDRLTGIVSVATITIPPFVVAVYSLLVFAVWLHWFPVIGAGEPGDLGSQLWHLAL